MKTPKDNFFHKYQNRLRKDYFQEKYLNLVFKFSNFLAAYHRFSYEGIEHIKQQSAPCIYVVNHSIGAPQDILFLINMWGREKLNLNVRGLAHKIAWIKPLSFLSVGKMGGIYAHPEVAQDFIDKGYSLICFPGGEVEAFRLFSERYKINLANRMGFIELAQKKQLNIVPITICGTHAFYINLFQWDFLRNFLAKNLRIKNFSISLEMLFIFLCFIPALWHLLPLALLKLFVPWPSKVILKVGMPITYKEMAPLDKKHIYVKVERSMQSTMNELAKRRVCPWF